MSKHCFVIMPFSSTVSPQGGQHTEDYWTKFFTDFIKPSVENLGYSCERSVATSSNIVKDIMVQLLESDIVLAVLTDYNPNVWYELGVRHTFRNGTVAIIQKGLRIPFDIQEHGVIQYEDSLIGRPAFENDLKTFIQKIEKENKSDSPVRDFFDQRAVKLISAFPSAQHSPLVFESAIGLAQQRFLLIGQNLHFLAKTSRLKDYVFSTLRKRALDIQILLCDPKPDYVARATRDLTGATFIEDLGESIAEFRQWQKQADAESIRRKLKGRLEIRLSKRIGNLSVTFVDPELRSGIMELTPVPFGSQSPARPRFLLTRKEHSEMFQAYWSLYDNIFRTGGSRSIRDIQIS